MRKSCQTDRENPTDPLDQDKQEALEKLGLSPPSHQRLNSLISQLHFPDVGYHDGRPCSDFLIKLLPERFITNGDLLNCAKKGFPCVIWLYNQLNVEESVWYSVKRDGPLCHIHANVGAGLKSSYSHSKHVSSARDAECSTVKKGWHLHASSPSALRFTLHSFTRCPTNTEQRHTASLPQQGLTTVYEGSLTFPVCNTDSNTDGALLSGFHKSEQV